MSSTLLDISPANMKIIQSVLEAAGYDASGLAESPRFFNPAALLVIKLFLAGEESRSGLAAKLEHQLGKFGDNRRPCPSSLARYAIQGLPLELQSQRLI